MLSGKNYLLSILIFILVIGNLASSSSYKRRYKYNYERCPKVRSMRNFQINDMMGFWYVMQYYASSEELSEYSCMRGIFAITDKMQVTMNFTYVYSDDPEKENLHGNITWMVPDTDILSHWIHTEDNFKDIYNTFVIDTDYNNWALIMHCAEKIKEPRYLSALMLSRTTSLGNNVKNFLREKLPKYEIDVSFMFDVTHDDCSHNITTLSEFYKYQLERKEENQGVKIININ